MADRRAARSGRLSRSAEFERVYRQGRAVGNRHLVVYSFATESEEPARVGLSVSRKVGSAVQRNHVKRLLREAVRSRAEQLGRGCDVVVIARPQLRALADRDGLSGVVEALEDALARGGRAADSGEEAG